MHYTIQCRIVDMGNNEVFYHFNHGILVYIYRKEFLKIYYPLGYIQYTYLKNLYRIDIGYHKENQLFNFHFVRNHQPFTRKMTYWAYRKEDLIQNYSIRYKCLHFMNRICTYHYMADRNWNSLLKRFLFYIGIILMLYCKLGEACNQ